MRGVARVPEYIAVEAPQTLEGWYTLHDVYRFDWVRWGDIHIKERTAIAAEARVWLEELSADPKRGDAKLYSVVTQKGDLMANWKDVAARR